MGQKKPRFSGKSKALIAVLGGGIAIACLIFFGLELRKLFADGQLAMHLAWQPIVFSALFYCISYACFAYGWHLLLKAMGIELPLRINLGIHATTQFAKYLPGNIGHHVGRAGLTARTGAPLGTVVTAMTLEILMVIAVLGLIGLPLLSRWLHLLATQSGATRLVVAGGLIAAAFGLSLIYIFRTHAWIHAVMGLLRAQLSGVRVRNWALIAAVTCIMVIGANGAGASLVALDASGNLHTFGNFAYMLSLYSVAFLLGFLTPGAPAGLGVREVILLEGLTPLIGREASLELTLLARLVSTISDLVIFVIGIALLKLTANLDKAGNREKLA